MEIEMMNKLKFKLYVKTYGYWIDLLTTMWDQYMYGWLAGGNSNSKRDNNSSSKHTILLNPQRALFFKRTL